MKIVIGKTGDDLCPVRALLTYLNARGFHPGPLFQWSSGIPLCKSKFVDEVRLALDIQPNSLPGTVLELEQPPLQHRQAFLIQLYIQTLGRWKSSAYLLYIMMELHKLARVSHMMSHCVI